MKRYYLPAILTLVSILPQTLSSAQILDWSSGKPITGESLSSIRTVELLTDGFTVTYSFPSYELFPAHDDPDEYQISVGGFATLSNTGEPSLPSKLEFFKVPDCELATIEILSSEWHKVDCKVTSVTHEHDAIAGRNVSVSTTGFYPQKNVEIVDRSIRRETDVIGVTVNPVQYDPSNEVIKVCSSLKYKVSYNTSNTKRPTKAASLYQTSQDVEFTTDMIGSSIMSSVPALSIDVTQSMLIVSVPEFAESLKSFIEWKRMLGINAYAVYSSNWTFDSVMDSIESAYNSDPALTYLLFVGRHSHVPGYIYDIQENSQKNDGICDGADSLYCPTDYYYSSINRTRVAKQLPLFYYGRIPVSNTNDLNSVITKIRQYESSPCTDSDFYRKSVHMAYIDTGILWKLKEYPDRDQMCFVPATEEITRYLTNLGYETEKLYSCRKPESSTYDFFKGTKYWDREYNFELIPDTLKMDVPSYWRHGFYDYLRGLHNGRFLAMYAGHGGVDRYYQTSWYGNGAALEATKIDTLTNGNKLPVMFNLSCMTGFFNYRSFAEAALTNAHGGVIGCFAASGFGYNGYDEVMGMRMIQSIWEQPLITKIKKANGVIQNPNTQSTVNWNRLRLGEIHQRGIKEMISLKYDKMIMAPHCFGDPSLKMRTEVPHKIPKFTYQDCGNNVLEVTTLGGFNTISFYDSTTGKVESYFGSKAKFEYTKKSKVSIVVHSDNAIPYIVEKAKLYPVDTIPVIPDPNPNPFPWITSCSVASNGMIEIRFDNPNQEDNQVLAISALEMTKGVETMATTLSQENGYATIEVPERGNYTILLRADNVVVDDRKINVNM